MKAHPFLKIEKAKLLITSSLLIFGIFIDAITKEIAVLRFLPTGLYYWLRPYFRNPGFDDVAMGSCRVPCCDQIVGVITLLVTLAVFYLISCALVAAARRRLHV